MRRCARTCRSGHRRAPSRVFRASQPTERGGQGNPFIFSISSSTLPRVARPQQATVRSFMKRTRVSYIGVVGCLALLLMSLPWGQQATAASDYEERVDCLVAEVAAFENRVHVRCSALYKPGTNTKHWHSGGLKFFALPLTSSSSAQFRANRLLEQALNALSGRLEVRYDSADTSSTSYGCSATNCRGPIDFGTNF